MGVFPGLNGCVLSIVGVGPGLSVYVTTAPSLQNENTCSNLNTTKTVTENTHSHSLSAVLL